MYKLLSAKYHRAALSVLSSEAEEEHKDGDPQPTFPESSTAASGYTTDLKPASQAEAPGGVSRLFHGKTGVCINLLSMWCPGGSSLSEKSGQW